MDKQEIQKQAKQLLDKFAKSLEVVEKDNSYKSLDAPLVDRTPSERNENSTIKPTNLDFKKRILKNAPNSNEDFIFTEKGSWKK